MQYAWYPPEGLVKVGVRGGLRRKIGVGAHNPSPTGRGQSAVGARVRARVTNSLAFEPSPGASARWLSRPPSPGGRGFDRTDPHFLSGLATLTMRAGFATPQPHFDAIHFLLEIP